MPAPPRSGLSRLHFIGVCDRHHFLRTLEDLELAGWAVDAGTASVAW